MTGRATLVLGILILIGLLVLPMPPLASALSGGGAVSGSFIISAPSNTPTPTRTATPTPTLTSSPSPTATSSPSPTATASPSPTATATPRYDDIYEEDDTPQSASWVETTGAAQVHSFHRPGDVDFVKFQAVAGASHTVATTNISGGADIVLELYGSDILTNPDAWPLASSDGSGGGFPLLTWRAPQSGTYYVKIRERFNRGDYLWYYICVTGGFKVFIPMVGLRADPLQTTSLRLPSFGSSPGFGMAVSNGVRAVLSLVRSLRQREVDGIRRLSDPGSSQGTSLKWSFGLSFESGTVSLVTGLFDRLQ